MGQVSPKSNWEQASWIKRKEEKIAIKGGGGKREGIEKIREKKCRQEQEREKE